MRRSARAFGEAVAAAPRTSAGNTALAASLRQAAQLLEVGLVRRRAAGDRHRQRPSERRRPGRRRARQGGRRRHHHQRAADHRQASIGTFDGVDIHSSHQVGIGGMAAFYRRDVIGGPGSFMLEARSIDAFAEALKRKLLRQLIFIAGSRSAVARLSRRGLIIADDVSVRRDGFPRRTSDRRTSCRLAASFPVDRTSNSRQTRGRPWKIGPEDDPA